MKPANEKKETARASRPRNQAEARQILIKAIGTLLAREGFKALGVNAVAKEAGLDKVLIYRYFGGMPELLQAFGKSGEFWPSAEELMGDDAALRKLPLAQRVPLVLGNYIRAIRRRPLTREILAWECVERNELAFVLRQTREEVSMQILSGSGIEQNDIKKVMAVTTLLSAAVNYLVVRSRSIQRFNTVDISSDDGWEELEKSIAFICERCFTPSSEAD